MNHVNYKTMDNSINNITNFENLLREQNNKRPFGIYGHENQEKCPNNASGHLTSKDIISNISSTLKALQKADNVKNDINKRRKLQKYKKSAFLPVTLLPIPDNEQGASTSTANKFETQFVSDTQLIDVITNAEAMMNNNNSQKGITQEFETTFCETILHDKETVEKSIESAPDVMIFEPNVAQMSCNELVDENIDVYKDCVVKSNDSATKNDRELSPLAENVSVLDTGDRYNRKNENKLDFNKSYKIANEPLEIETKSKKCIEETERSKSPILKIQTKKPQKNVSQQLVYNLDVFEEFERIIAPLLSAEDRNEDTFDFDSVKHLITSQVLSKRLIMQPGSKTPISNTLQEPSSPILERKRWIETKRQRDAKECNILNNEPKTNENLLPEERNCVTPVSLSSEILKDEILFSSDEEDDYINKNAEELPLTCALETSFYTNQSDILDKTIFVGFQTASNKSIQVCTDSFDIAKTVFNDVDKKCLNKKQISLTELVEQCDNQKTSDKCEEKYFKIESAKSILPDEAFLKIDAKRIGQVSEEINESNEKSSRFLGCKTASNTMIKLSDAALSVAKKIFQDIDDSSTDYGKNKYQTNTVNTLTKEEEIISKSENKYEGDLNKSNTDNQSIFEKSDIVNEEDLLLKEFCTEIDFTSQVKEEKKDVPTYKYKKPSLIGFKTASNKQINISEQAFARTKALFQDLHPGDETDTVKATYTEKKAKYEAEGFLGFKTAIHKHIQISKEALAEKIFQDIDTIPADVDSKSKSAKLSQKTPLPEENDQNSDMFEEPAPETISISPDILDLGRKIAFIGFKTASNKEVRISEQALVKTKKIFQDIDLANTDTNDKNSRFIDTKNLIASEEALEKPNAEIQNIDDNLEPILERGIGFVGFKTANNKNVKISKKALEKSKHIFKDIETDVMDKFNTHNVINREPSFKGFQTASNKQVEVSDEALKRSKKIFKDIAEEILPEKALAITDEFIDDNDFLKCDNDKIGIGFQTDSKKKVTISEDALAISKNILQSVDMDRKHENFSPFVGFQTANHKKVNISEDSLAKTKKIFEDLEIEKGPKEIVAPTAFVGFQTASNKKVTVSEEALSKTKAIFQDISLSQNVEIEPTIATANQFGGFRTANHKKVNISEDALAKTKKIFEDLEMENAPKEIVAPKRFVGFQTASNKKVAVSEEALSKTKEIFQDIGLSQNVEPSTATANPFGGFQTANHKKVVITEESLLKTRNVFNGIDKEQNNIIKPQISVNSANNNYTELSEVGLIKSIKHFPENNKEITIQSNHNKGDENIDKELINTQVLNNFEETLYTEDFCASPKNRKKPGSPIIPCPKAKRRKFFKIPYKQLINNNETPKSITKIIEKTENKLIFKDDYKKNKIHTLKDLDSLEKSSNTKRNIDPYLLEFCFENILDLKFSGSRNTITDDVLSMKEIKDYFLASVNTKIVPDGWLDNHLKLILWKLISYEIKFPKTMENACNTRNIIDQLKYRYDRELYNVERPVLRKILEKDDSSARTMVLCVASVLVDGVSVASVANITNTATVELLLTDGWYCIKTSIDRMLTKLVVDSRIVAGCKLIVAGAELLGCEQGIAPWEDTSSVRLKISGNSTRLARWDSRLGRHGNGAILTPWSAVRADGGKVCRCRVLVTRVYPALYVHKYEDGNTVTRSERLEQIYQAQFEAERQTLLEKLYEEVEREIADQESQDSDTIPASGAGGGSKRRCMETGSQIAKMMKRSKDPQEFRSHLSADEARLLEAHTTRRRDHLLQTIEARVQDKLVESGLHQIRNVVCLLKIRVAGVIERDEMLDISKGMLSIWKPSDAILELLQEGTWVDVMNIVPTGERNSEIQASAGRQSTFSRAKVKETEKLKALVKSLSRSCISIKNIVQNPCLRTDYNEIDTVGLIFLIEPSNIDFERQSVRNMHFQNVYLTDADKNMISINFWGGIKKFGFENILDTGQFVAGINLQKRIGNTRKNIPQYRATEFTYFTKVPKNETSRNAIEELIKKFHGIDRRKFCEDCVELKNNFSVLKHQNYNENVSPYGFNKTDYNLSRNRMFIDSPLIQKVVTNKKEQEDLSLTGLDFESTFKQRESQDISPEMQQRKRRVNEKIAKLKMYGEPPPLSPIHITNKSKNASKSYKSPLVSKQNLSKCVQKFPAKENVTKNYHPTDPTDSVASVSNQKLPDESPKTTTLNKDELVSPLVSMNRTFVKRNVNPTKLNFSNDIIQEENVCVDQFADDFDSSPPLSLD